MGNIKKAYKVSIGKCESDDLEESGVGRRSILKYVLNKEGKNVDWIRLVQIIEQCYACVNTVTKYLFPIRGERFLD
jgi:hypothetical protein